LTQTGHRISAADGIGTARADRIPLGIALVLASTLLTALQEATIKFASSDMTLWQIYVLRSAFLIPILLVIAAIWRSPQDRWTDALRPWPLARAMMFVMMYFSMYSVLPYLHLSTIAAGVYTAPLFVACLSFVLLGEPVGWRGLLAIGLGFCGVLVMLRPGTDAFDWLTLVPVMGGLFYALQAIITRSKCRRISPSSLAVSLAFALLVVGAVASLLLQAISPEPATVSVAPFLLDSWARPGFLEWTVIAVLTLLMVGNGLVLPAAYQLAPTVIIATFDYCYLIFATLLGYLLFAEVPDIQSVLGMVMIVSAGLIIVRR